MVRLDHCAIVDGTDLYLHFSRHFKEDDFQAHFLKFYGKGYELLNLEPIKIRLDDQKEFYNYGYINAGGFIRHKKLVLMKEEIYDLVDYSSLWDILLPEKERVKFLKQNVDRYFDKYSGNDNKLKKLRRISYDGIMYKYILNVKGFDEPFQFIYFAGTLFEAIEARDYPLCYPQTIYNCIYGHPFIYKWHNEVYAMFDIDELEREVKKLKVYEGEEIITGERLWKRVYKSIIKELYELEKKGNSEGDEHEHRNSEKTD